MATFNNNLTKFGVLQGDIVEALDRLSKQIDGICAKLDADSGVNDTNFEALYGLGGSNAAAIPSDQIDASDA